MPDYIATAYTLLKIEPSDDIIAGDSSTISISATEYTKIDAKYDIRVPQNITGYAKVKLYTRDPNGWANHYVQLYVNGIKRYQVNRYPPGGQVDSGGYHVFNNVYLRGGELLEFYYKSNQSRSMVVGKSQLCGKLTPISAEEIVLHKV